MMIKTLEAELRKEEAKLSMLRKLRISQQHSVRQVLYKLMNDIATVINIIALVVRTV